MNAKNFLSQYIVWVKSKLSNIKRDSFHSSLISLFETSKNAF